MKWVGSGKFKKGGRGSREKRTRKKASKMGTNLASKKGRLVPKKGTL